LRIEPLVWHEALYAFSDGDWDRSLQIIEDGRNETIWTAARDMFKANILVARDGPSSGGLEIADEARRRSLAADTQSRVGASFSCTAYFLAERYDQCLERADTLLEFLKNGHATGPSIPVGLPALRAAWVLKDEATARGWVEALAERRLGAGSAAIDAYVQGVTRRMAGRTEEACASFEVALKHLGERAAPLAESIARQDLIETLLDLGRPEDAKTTAQDMLLFWRKVRATWYLGRLEVWLAERDLAVKP